MVRQTQDTPPRPPSPPRPPEVRVIVENGVPPTPPKGIREVKDGLPKRPKTVRWTTEVNVITFFKGVLVGCVVWEILIRLIGG